MLLLAILSAGGCCWSCRPHYGFILRGDWSLELNRLPWIGTCETGSDCADPGVHAVPGSAIPGPAVPELPQLPADADSSHLHSSQSGYLPAARAGYLAWLLRCWPHRCADAPSEPDGEVAWGHSRFYPVPTRPVFWPQTPAALAANPAQWQGYPSAPPAPPPTEGSAPLPPTTTRTSQQNRVSANGHGAVADLDEQARTCRSCPLGNRSGAWLFTQTRQGNSPAGSADMNAVAGAQPLEAVSRRRPQPDRA